MTRQRLVLIAGAGSLILLAAAFAFQAAGYLPCKMCLWQRWPHVVAIVTAGLYLVWAGKPLLAKGVLAMLVTAGIGGYHTGAERGWWEGPDTCTGNGAGLRFEVGPGETPLITPTAASFVQTRNRSCGRANPSDSSRIDTATAWLPLQPLMSLMIGRKTASAMTAESVS